ncbi:MAG: hypothetical protein ACLTLQ_09785 [[Clostridium] scindens]
MARALPLLSLAIITTVRVCAGGIDRVWMTTLANDLSYVTIQATLEDTALERAKL